MKTFILSCLAVLMFGTAFSQQRLLITKMREETWNSNDKSWSGWPSTFTYYDKGSEPILTITRLDNDGYKFRVDMDIKGEKYSFDVTYSGYDSKNDWYKYDDVDGNQICIVGSTMSKLSQYGWPDSLVDIYFWIYTDNIAFDLE